MKLIKNLTVIACALAILAGTTTLQANCGGCAADKACPAGDKKAAKCCEDAKKAGKTCEKCTKKSDKKSDKK